MNGKELWWLPTRLNGQYLLEQDMNILLQEALESELLQVVVDTMKPDSLQPLPKSEVQFLSCE
jgi:hypothetical protein